MDHLFVHFVFIWLGVAVLLPWNTLLRAFQYLYLKLANTPFENTFMPSVTSTYTVVSTLTSIALVLWQVDEFMIKKRSGERKHFFDSCSRINFGLLLNIIFFLVIAIFPIADLITGGKGLLGGSLFFFLLLAIVGSSGLVFSIMQKGICAMLARFPSAFAPSLMGGQAISGVLTSIINVAISWITADTSSSDVSAYVVKGAVVSFSITLVALGITVLLFYFLKKRSLFFRSTMGFGLQTFDVFPTSKPGFGEFTNCLKRIWGLALGVFGTLCATITFINSFIVDAKAPLNEPLSKNPSYLGSFTGLAFLVYDLGDLFGRWMPSISPLAFHTHSVLPRLLPWARFVFFVPLFLASPVKLDGKVVSFFKLGTSEIAYFVVVFLFGLTNGYLCTLCLMHAPAAAVSTLSSTDMKEKSSPFSSEEDARMKEVAGATMGMFINLGLAAGSVSSFAFKAVLELFKK